MAVEELTRFAANKVTIPMYIDTTKTFIQLATSLLGLSVVFREKIVGGAAAARVSRTLVASWAFLLLSVAAGALYQYRAVKFLESLSAAPGGTTLFDRLFSPPAVLYAAMLIFFFVGATFVALAAWQGLTEGQQRGAG
jgi:hypothetical protein